MIWSKPLLNYLIGQSSLSIMNTSHLYPMEELQNVSVQISIPEFALPEVGLLRHKRDNKQSTLRNDDAFTAMKEELPNARRLRNHRNGPTRNSYAQEVSLHRMKRGNEDKAPGQEETKVVPKTSLGCHSLKQIRKRGAIYVDRTEMAYNIIKRPYTSISLFLRPHRFGKTLLLDVFQSILRHNQEDLELLRGTYVQNLAKQLPHYTVLKFNFQDLNTAEKLEQELWDYADFYGVGKKIREIEDENRQLRRILQPNESEEITTIFGLLLGELQKPVAVLVDEHSIVFDNANEATRNYFLDFFQSFKGLKAEKKLQFAFITGSDKVSMEMKGLGTTLGIEDISENVEYANLLGFTHDDIEKHYHLLVERKAEVCRQNVTMIYEQMRKQYNGYQFGDNESPFVYNPMSVMEYLEDVNNFEGKNYWLKTIPNSAAVIQALIEDCNLLHLNKTVLNLDSSWFPTHELYHNEVSPFFQDKYQKNCLLEGILFRHGYLTTKYLSRKRGERTLKFPNNEAREGFQQAITNAMAKTKEGTALGITAWKSLDNEDMTEFAEAFNEFIKYRAYQDMINTVTNEVEVLHKNFIEAVMTVGICEGCKIYREKTLTETSEGKLITTRPDFIFDTKDKRIYAGFKYKSGLREFQNEHFKNSYREYKFHTCETPHVKGIYEATKIKILINLDTEGIGQWYGPKKYEFKTDAEEDEQLATETFDETYLEKLWEFP